MRLAGADELTPGQRRAHGLSKFLLLPLVVVLVAIVTPLYLLYDVARVQGSSMEPTLSDSEYVLVTRGWKTPQRGDIVVVAWSHDGVTEQIIKRIVAIGGDTIDVYGDTIRVNGRAEPFPHGVIDGTEVEPRFETVVPTSTVFVLGDNRPVSLDSRFIGPLPSSAVSGRIVAVWAPVTRIRVVPSPETAGL